MKETYILGLPKGKLALSNLYRSPDNEFLRIASFGKNSETFLLVNLDSKRPNMHACAILKLDPSTSGGEMRDS